MHKKYNSLYIGYVVQNNDPDQGGKVKIFVPSIMPTLGGISSEINADNAGVQIDFSDLSRVPPAVLAQIKNALPWARQVSPLIGSGSPTIFNARDHTTSRVDAPMWRKFYADLQKQGARSDSPRRHGALSQIFQFIFKGAFGSKTTNDESFGEIPITPVTSPTNNFSSGIKSNMAKGAFSIPSVGAVVWMFFENGEWDLPVYFGYQHATTAWREIFDGTGGYPGALENNPGTGTSGTAEDSNIVDGVDIDAKAGEGSPTEGSGVDSDFVGPPAPGQMPPAYGSGNGSPPPTAPADDGLRIDDSAPPQGSSSGIFGEPQSTTPPGSAPSTAPTRALKFNTPAQTPQQPTPTRKTIEELSPQMPLLNPRSERRGGSIIG